jgi:hypothetical protein
LNPYRKKTASDVGGLNAMHVNVGFWACAAVCVAASIATSHERGDAS